MTALTATRDEVVVLDAVEQTLVEEWKTLLRRGHTPVFVLARIIDAHHYEPRFGLPMDVCERAGCELFVDESARDDLGRLYCSEAHRDADDEEAEQRRIDAERDRRADGGRAERRSDEWPADIPFFPPTLGWEALR